MYSEQERYVINVYILPNSWKYLYNPQVTTAVDEPYSVDVPISVGRVAEISKCCIQHILVL